MTEMPKEVYIGRGAFKGQYYVSQYDDGFKYHHDDVLQAEKEKVRVLREALEIWHEHRVALEYKEFDAFSPAIREFLDITKQALEQTGGGDEL